MSADRTGIRVPPPVLFALPLLIGGVLERRWPWTLFPEPAIGLGLGLLLVVFGAVVAGAAVLQFRKGKTTVLPFGGTSTIVGTGVYRWTRNPMYLGMASGQAGIALMANSVWCLAALPASVRLVYQFAIRLEEQYLSRKFGAAYEAYRTSVRRWI